MSKKLKNLEFQFKDSAKAEVPLKIKRKECHPESLSLYGPLRANSITKHLPSSSNQINEYKVIRNENYVHPLIKPSTHQEVKVNIPLHPELTLLEMGFDQNRPFDLENISLPAKSSLFELLSHRVHNFINPDFIVRIGDEEFHCHHLMLACYSAYFDILKVREVILPEDKVTKLAFQIIYDWIIFPEEDMMDIMTRKNILQVFIAAQYLGIKDLEEQCWAYIDSEDVFSEGAAFALYMEARALQVYPVMQLMIQRITKFFLVLVSSKDFLELDVDELCILINSNYISVNSEMEVLLSAVRWLMHDWDERRKYIIQVMHCIRFGLIEPRSLVDIKRNPENPELIEIMSIPTINAMREDGLSFSIIQYWHEREEEQFYHWIEILGLHEPEPRNWIRQEPYTRHATYRDFLIYLDHIRDRGKVEYELEEEIIDRERGSSIVESIDIRDIPTITEHLAARDLIDSSKAGESELSELNRNVEDFTKVVDDKPSTIVVDAYTQKTHRSMSTKSLQTMETAQPLRIQKDENKEENVVSLAVDIQLEEKRTLSSLMNIKKPRSVSNTTLTLQTLQYSKIKQRTSEMNVLSMFSDSFDKIGVKMNQISSSIITSPSKDYLVDGSLFSFDRETVLVFGGTDPHSTYGKKRNTGKDIYRYLPENNMWEFVSELPMPRHHHGAVFFKGRVYLAGGADPRCDEYDVVNTMWSFEPVSRAWFIEKSMVAPRKNFAFVTINMKLYAIGGIGKNGRLLSCVEQYDPTTGMWLEVAPMSVARMGIACTKFRDYIWCAGGMSEAGLKRNRVSAIVELYNPHRNEWVRMKDLRFPCAFAQMFPMNDKLHLIGGATNQPTNDHKNNTSSSAIDVWDNKAKEWRLQTEMTIPRHGHSISHLGTQILIIGGMTTAYMRALGSVECYCCERSKWLPGVTDVPTKLSGHASLSLPPASIM